MLVGVQALGLPGAVGDVEDRPEPVRGRLVGAEDAEVAEGGVRPQRIGQELAEHAGGLGVHGTRRGHVDRVVAEVGERQGPHQRAAVGVGARAHAPLAARRQGRQLGDEGAVAVEELLGPVGAQPRLELGEVLGPLGEARERHLVRAPGALGGLAVHRGRAGPPLGRAQHDHRPEGARPRSTAARGRLEAGDVVERLVQRRRHGPVHQPGIGALDEEGAMAVAAHQALELLAGDPREEGRPGDLVAVEVEDRQHRAVTHRIEELVRVPAGGERSGLGLAVADDAAHDQTGVVEGRSVGVGQRVAELATLVDRAGGLGRDVARDAPGERELAEEPAQALGVAADLGVDLGVGPLQVGVRHQRRPAVAGTGDVEGLQVALRDRPVHVRVDEVQPRRGAPVAQQPRLDVLDAQGLTQQGVVEEVDLPDRQVVRRAPVGVDAVEFPVVEHRCGRSAHDAAPAEASARRAPRAMATSSRERTTSVRTVAPPAETSASPPGSALRR